MDKKEYQIKPEARLVLKSYDGERFFGIGLSELLERIETTGSIRKAGMEMGMAYSKCWRILRRAEQCLGFTLLEGTAGGSNGGGSILTKEGKEFLESYNKAQKDLEKYTAELFEKYF